MIATIRLVDAVLRGLVLGFPGLELQHWSVDVNSMSSEIKLLIQTDQGEWRVTLNRVSACERATSLLEYHVARSIGSTGRDLEYFLNAFEDEYFQP